MSEINEMRIALIVQIDELIDIASAYEVKMEYVGDFDEARRVRGAIAYARNIAAPYKYNGPYQPRTSVQTWQQIIRAAPRGEPISTLNAALMEIDAWRAWATAGDKNANS
jgi:hypothetical protein